MAYFLCSAIFSSSSFSIMLSCCSCIFSTFNLIKRPWRRPILIAVNGSNVWTWTFTKSSSCTQTIELPIVANSSLKLVSEKWRIPFSDSFKINSVQKPYSSSPPSTFVWALSPAAFAPSSWTGWPSIAARKPSKITQSPFPPLSTTPTSASTGNNSGVLCKEALASSTIFFITSMQSVTSSVVVYAYV